MTTKTKRPEFVSARKTYVRGREVVHYFAGYDGGYRLVRISKKRYDRLKGRVGGAFDNRLAERKQKATSANGHGTTPGAGHCWPLACEALANHPSQNEAFREAYKKHGVNVELRRDGTPICPDEGAYRRLRKVHGAFHRNSFNG